MYMGPLVWRRGGISFMDMGVGIDKSIYLFVGLLVFFLM